MRKALIVTMGLVLLLGFGGNSLAQMQQNPCQGQQMMGQGQAGPQGEQGSGTRKGTPMHFGKGMMGSGMMRGGMGMMGPGMMGMMKSPEIMGTMMSIHGDIMSLMGRMMQQYGATMDQKTPELQQQMQNQMLEQMGEILTKHGMALKEKAKAAGK